jgi:hypothetical protein
MLSRFTAFAAYATLALAASNFAWIAFRLAH